MKPGYLLTVLLIGSTLLSNAQMPGKRYYEEVRKADSLYNAGDYVRSAKHYTEAFRSNRWKGLPNEIYNAACTWSLSAQPDSAFRLLNRFIELPGYLDYNPILRDGDFTSLHKDVRWRKLTEAIKIRKAKAEVNLNRLLAAELDSILVEDQKYRNQLSEMQAKHAWNSPEMQNFLRQLTKTDSINLIKVTRILDQYGWAGPDVVGASGSTALFLVIQHGDIKTQQRYLPLMREAVKNGKAKGSSLALLEDRVALREGRRQTYGSQIGYDNDTKQYYISPLEDPDQVDSRRASVGLGPLANYVVQWQIKWDVEQYKRDLPKLEEKLKKQQ